MIEVLAFVAALSLIALYVLVYTGSPLLSDLFGTNPRSLLITFTQVFGVVKGSTLGPASLTIPTVIGAGVIFFTASVRPTIMRRIVITATLAAFLGLFFVSRVVSVPVLNTAFAPFTTFNPSLEAVAGDAKKRRSFPMNGLIEVARFAKDELPGDAIFLTPPDFAAFRVFAERAIIVDVKSWPSHSPGIWFRRLEDVYGPLNRTAGLLSRTELKTAFKAIDDLRIREIALEYDASYAVLFGRHRTRYPVLLKGNVYKIIALKSGVHR